MSGIISLIETFVTYGLCLYYSAKTLLGITILFITKYNTKFWVVKERPTPPAVLTNEDHGVHKYIRANGIKLHYVENGDSSKPLMLFIHGFPEFWYSWRYQLKEFSKDYWVIAVDMRGYGDSDKPKNVTDYTIDKMVADIRSLITELGREKFTLVAHDWGAVIGWSYIVQHMETIDKYVMMDAPSPAVWKKLVLRNMEQFLMSWYIFFFQMPYLPEFASSMFDLKTIDTIFKHSKTVSAEDVEAYKYTFSQKNALTYPINYYRANLKKLGNSKITKPTKFAPGLYLLGETDLYISKKSGPLLQKYYDNLDFKIVKNANHFAQQDQPEEVNRLMREFLKN